MGNFPLIRPSVPFFTFGRSASDRFATGWKSREGRRPD